MKMCTRCGQNETTSEWALWCRTCVADVERERRRIRVGDTFIVRDYVYTVEAYNAANAEEYLVRLPDGRTDWMRLGW